MKIDEMLERMLNEHVIGTTKAFAALTVAIGQVIGKDKLAEQLRVQLIAPPTDTTGNQVREELLKTAWLAIRPPQP